MISASLRLPRLSWVPLTGGAFSATPPVFVFYCSVTNDHKPTDLKKYMLIISVSVRQESENDLDRSFAQGLTSLQSLCWWVPLLSKASKPPQVVGRIPFLLL